MMRRDSPEMLGRYIDTPLCHLKIKAADGTGKEAQQLGAGWEWENMEKTREERGRNR